MTHSFYRARPWRILYLHGPADFGTTDLYHQTDMSGDFHIHILSCQDAFSALLPAPQSGATGLGLLTETQTCRTVHNSLVNLLIFIRFQLNPRCVILNFATKIFILAATEYRF